MAVCTYCSQEMVGGSSCSVEVLHRDGAAFPVQKVSQRDGPRTGDKAGRCGDCGAPAGGFHHLGCDMQRCPCCRGQLMCCGCWFDEDGTDIADDEDKFLAWIHHRWEDYLDEAS